jgi:hypothetical protein
MREHNVLVSDAGTAAGQRLSAVSAPRQVSLCNANFSGSD